MASVEMPPPGGQVKVSDCRVTGNAVGMKRVS